MRLLDIETYKLSEYHGSDIPPYLIASHRWYEEEPTFKDVCKQRNQECRGYHKIRGFCNFALKGAAQSAGVTHLWIDTCCIDKSSSAELTESINSMMRFYAQSQCCLVYLADVRSFESGWDEVEKDFESSEWFERAWTLQELLAPELVLFLNSEWQVIGHKGRLKRDSIAAKLYGSFKIRDLTSQISVITGIPREVLRDYKRSKKLSFEQKKMWVASRKTTRDEDLAYCLLGIFDVHMPLVYGEGTKAHNRLLREIAEKDKAYQGILERKKIKKAFREERRMEKMLFYESFYAELPIVPPSNSCESEAIKELRDAGIVSLLSNNRATFHRQGREIPVVLTASTLKQLGFPDPGEVLHQALYRVHRQSLLVRAAFADTQVLEWSRSQATEHMIEVLRAKGHPRELAVRMLAVYLEYNEATFAHLEFPYIEPAVPYGQDTSIDDTNHEEGVRAGDHADRPENRIDSGIDLRSDWNDALNVNAKALKSTKEQEERI